jgi:predicted Zn-dependent peptidase
MRASLLNDQVHIHRFENGLVLLAEPMDWVESAAFSWLLPAGCCYDPPDQLGLASFTCEMVQRGCGSWTSREFVERLDNLGIVRSAGLSLAHTQFGAAMPRQRLGEALQAYSQLVQSPLLPLNQIEDARLVGQHDIHSVQDAPAQRLMQAIRRQHYPDPLGRSSQGTLEGIAAIGHEQVTRFHSSHYHPDGSILAVAGNIEWNDLLDQVGRLLSDWNGPAGDIPVPGEAPAEDLHISHPSSQTHIGIAFDAIPYSDPDYFQLRGAIGVLSDGMSSRLFTEVRENRGLCYAVQASCLSLKDRGSVITYAGTTSERAQETLDVTMDQLVQLGEGIEAGELERLKARIKSALIMMQESSGSRSESVASDWYYLERVYSLEELNRIVDDLSCQSINRYLSDNPPADFLVVTLGEQPLEIPRAVS